MFISYKSLMKQSLNATIYDTSWSCEYRFFFPANFFLREFSFAQEVFVFCTSTHMQKIFYFRKPRSMPGSWQTQEMPVTLEYPLSQPGRGYQDVRWARHSYGSNRLALPSRTPRSNAFSQSFGNTVFRRSFLFSGLK